MSRQPVTCACGGVGYARGMCRPCYQRHRNRQIAYGRWDPQEFVAADAARAHVERLQGMGINLTQLAALSGVDRSSVDRITRDGEIRLTSEMEAAILAVQVPERAADVVPGNALVPIHGARRRIQALVAFGYPRNQLARELGMVTNSGVMEGLLGKPRNAESLARTISADRERAVKALFDRLQMTPGPSERARARGRRNGWALPFEWDEAALDDPRGKPVRARWTHASATAERREQVTDLTERGLSAEQIAHRLGVTSRTVVRARVLTKPQSTQPVSEIEVMGALALRARGQIEAQRAGRPGRERTR
ncbi:hypothetical protein ACQP1G_34250 [Nocardia sp. CA-107356]|uniref:hypothetical protein n=1 Tax=Nocardia sp. CA-107356 TaxID=3239972 RepID=UPI003D8EE5FC